MRILLTTHQFLPEFSAGTEILTCSVAHELINRGHEVHVFTGFPRNKRLADNERFDEYDFDGIHVYRFHHVNTPIGGQESMIETGYNNRLAENYFDSIVGRFFPDLVHFFHLNRMGTGLIECAFKAGLPRFLTPTDFWTICPTGQLLLEKDLLCRGPTIYAGNCLKHLAGNTHEGAIGRVAEWLPLGAAEILVQITRAGILPNYSKSMEVKALANRLPVNIHRLNKLSRILAPNKFMKDILINNGVKSSLIEELSYGVDSMPVNIANKKTLNTLRIGFIGTLAKHKGCHILIDAFRAMNCNGASLKIYGKFDDFPDYFKSLQLLVGNYSSIEFCGTFDNSKIGDIFSNFDVLVVPSIWYENTPLVVLSAQNAKCPVVASNLPGLTSVIEHGENGLLFEPGNSSDLAFQLTRLVNEKKLLERLKSQMRASKSTATYVDELLDVWEGELQTTAPTRRRYE